MGVYDVMTARMSEIMGSPSLFLGSSAVDEFYGVPGLGLTASAYKLDYVRPIVESVEIPALLDIDDDAPTPIALYHDVVRFEKSGIGALHLVDGRPSLGTGFFSQAEMVDRIRAAVDARKDMVITARCQVAGTEGIDRAIERGVAYAQAGAEGIWYTGVSFADMPRVAQTVPSPLIGQLGSNQSMGDARSARLTVAIYASLVQNIAQSAVYSALKELRDTGLMVTAAKGVRLGSTVPADVANRMRRTDLYTETGRKYKMNV
jgi:methylisocitrate lyase